MLISNLILRWIKYYSTRQPTHLLHYVSTGIDACVSPRAAPQPSCVFGQPHRLLPQKELWGESVRRPRVRLALTALSRLGKGVLCVHPRLHSRIHSDTRCHLKLNSGENQYDKLRLVLSLNCFSLEIDTGARAIHHSLREVGAPRENGRASVRSRGEKNRKGENEMGVSEQLVETGVSLWQGGQKTKQNKG